jgi:putative CocE/NonD family hydrolase
MDERVSHLPLVPFPPIDERAGGLSPLFDRTVRGEFLPPQQRVDVADIAAPALVMAGWYDVFLQHDLEQFTTLRGRGNTEEARALSRLVVGPWSHGTFLMPVGELDYGLRASALLIDLRESLSELQRRWFDARLKGARNGIDDEPRVKVFVMGVNRWAEEDEWPPRRVRPDRWYLRASEGDDSGPASETGASGAGRGKRGSLSPQAPPGGAEPSAFALDPDNPVRTRGGTLLMSAHHIKGPRDQRRTEEHPDVLLFTSERLGAPLELRGRVRLHCWVAAATPDSDVVARLCDVHPDGTSYNIVDGVLRLRYRELPASPRPMPPGEPVRVEVDLWSTAHVFLPGHRLRLHVCASDFPRYDRCPGDGRTSAEVDRVLPQRNLLFHEAERPSHLELPVLPS